MRARVDVDIVHAHAGAPEDAQLVRTGQELGGDRGRGARDDTVVAAEPPVQLARRELVRHLVDLDSALAQIGDALGRDGADPQHSHGTILAHGRITAFRRDAGHWANLRRHTSLGAPWQPSTYTYVR